MIELGCTYKDKITGFQGIATGHVDYITGCNQTLLAPFVKEDGDKRNSHWFDDQRLELISTKEQVILDNGETPGCDAAAPTD